MIGRVCGDCRVMSNVGVPTLAVLLSVLAPIVPCAAYDGALDPTWDGDGSLTLGVTNTYYRAQGVALQCDGKVVVVGMADAVAEYARLLVARYDPDGSLDASFATGGIFTHDFSYPAGAGWDLAVQTDGKIVAIGFVDDWFAGWKVVVARLTASGQLDPSFSTDGFHTFQFGGSSRPRGVALQDDGRIVVVGSAQNTTALAVARLTSSGVLDTSFDDDGIVLIDFTLGDDDGWDVAIQPNGRIVVVGTASVGGGSVVVAARLLTDGAVDTSFGPGGGGATAIDFGVYSEGRGVALQPDGRIVVAGFTDASTAIAVARLTVDGMLDTTFSGDGMATLDLVLGPDQGYDVALQRDGRAVVVGTGYFGGRQNLAIVRFRPDGGLDSAMGGNGWVLVDFASDSYGHAVAFQPHDSKIVVAGKISTAPSESLLTVVRVIGDESLIFSDTFECGGQLAWSYSAP